jgi:23S rRNA pseudouridine2605 synthase
MAKQLEKESEKLQKILARAGFGSRREVEKYIADGLVKVNGRIAQLGDRAFATDNIQFRGNAVKETRLAKQATQVILYNKPEGQVCTRKDEKERTTIFEKLPRIINGRWISIGRLDINTSGLLILTNNGELANRMMHPSYEIEREYSVRVFGEVSEEIIYRLKKGVKLEDGMAKFDKISKLPKQDDDSINNWYKVVIKEGRNREVRRIWESQGVQVSRLIRTGYGMFELPRKLKQSKTEELSWKQINQLLKSVGMKEEARPDLRYKSPYDENKKSYVKTSKNTRSGNNDRVKRSSNKDRTKSSTKNVTKKQRTRT